MSAQAPPAVFCPRCSASVEATQEYCLECGLRLPHEQPSRFERAADTVAERRPWAGPWLLPTLLGLVIAVLGGGAAIAISSNGEEATAVSTATGGSLTVTDSTATLTAPEPVPTTTARTTQPPPATTAPPQRPRIPATVAWPAGKRGWTIVLVSLTQATGRAAAAGKAAEARKAGLRRVGILDSSRYASLHPGYYVVFMGVYESEADAASSLRRARTVFSAAYQREIVP